MISCTLYDCCRTGVTYGKTLTYLTVDVECTACCTIKQCISTQRERWSRFLGCNHNTSAVHPFTDIVVARTIDKDIDPFGQECTQRLSGGSCHFEGNCTFWQPFVTVACRDLS